MKKIMITCQCATNKGDRAIAEYIISKIQEYSDAEITLSTTDCNLWNNMYKNINVIPMGYSSLIPNIKNDFLNRVQKNIDQIYYDKVIYPDLVNKNSNHNKCEKISKQFVNEVKKSDLVIVTGGHHVTSIRNKNALFPFTYDIGLVSLYAKKYIMWSQTIGPLKFYNDDVKNFFGRVINNADTVCIRDKNSEICLNENFNIKDNILKSYDSVFGFGNLPFCEYDKRSKKVGISIFNGLKKAAQTYEKIAVLLDWYAEKGYEIEFFRMEQNDQEEKDINKVISLMKNTGNIKIFPFNTTTLDHLNEVATCKYFIGYKTHSVIMSLTTATPLIALAYHQKTIDFMKDYGMEKYAVSDENLNADTLVEMATDLENTGYEIHKQLQSRSKELSKIIDMDFKRTINYV